MFLSRSFKRMGQNTGIINQSECAHLLRKVVSDVTSSRVGVDEVENSKFVVKNWCKEDPKKLWFWIDTSINFYWDYKVRIEDDSGEKIGSIRECCDFLAIFEVSRIFADFLHIYSGTLSIYPLYGLFHMTTSHFTMPWSNTFQMPVA